MADENKLVIAINGTAKDFIEEIDKVKKETAELEKVLKATAKASAVAFAGFAASIALVTKEFADYEKALVGVGKTTNIEGKNLERFGKEFQKLSSEIPISTNELLGIAQAAGQLGVTGEDNLLKFTDTVAKLGVATDLAGEEAATALTRILNVTGEGIETIDTFGSVIVQLGNNFAATESEIVKVANEVARSSAVFGVSSTEAAGLAAAMKSMGIQAQLGGSAVGKAFRTIDTVIRKGGKPLEDLIALTGMSGEQLAKTFEEDATAVFTSFIQGLERISKEGGSVSLELEKFKLKGDEINKVLPVLAKNSDLLGKALTTASKEAKNASALNAEAAKAFDTLSSEAQRTRNNLSNLATNIGGQLAPEITNLLESINGIIKSIAEADEQTLSIIASFLKWGTIITGLIASITSFALSVLSGRAALKAVDKVFGPLISKITSFIPNLSKVTSLFGNLSRVSFGGIAKKFLGLISLVELSGDTIKDNFKASEGSVEQLRQRLTGLESQLSDIQGLDIQETEEQKKFREGLEKEIELYKQLIKEKETASKIDSGELDKDFGTGSLLIRPDASFEGQFPELVPPKQEQQIPLDVGISENDVTERLKQQSKKRTEVIDAETRKRIATAKQTNEELKAIAAARAQGETEEEREVLERKAEIQNEFKEAERIKNEQERNLTLKNLRLQHAEELAEIKEFEAGKDERKAERDAQRKALDDELAQLSKSQRDALNADDIKALQEKVVTEKDIERKAAIEQAERQLKDRNRFIEDEKKFGTVYATLNKALYSQEVETASNAANSLVQLSRSKNATLKGIGKAAARVNAAIATYEGAIKAYSSLAGIPIVGPALGAAAAAAVIAFGVEQQAQISAAQTGGFVPPSQGGARDRTIMALEPDELVVPKRLANPFISAVGNPESGDFANDDATAPTNGGETVLRLEGDLIQNDTFVSALATKLKELQEFDNVRV